MIKKNTFRFAAFTAAALGLSLLVSGCGDGGSVEPNPLDGLPRIVNSVTFNYKLLAETVANARQEIEPSITSVKFSFVGLRDKVAFCDITDSYKLEHGSEDTDYDLVVENVDPNSTKVTAAYFDKDGNLVAVGVNELNWHEQNATVGSPVVTNLGNDYIVGLSTDKDFLPLNSDVQFSLNILPEGEELPVDITPFATFSGIDENVFAPSASKLPGAYSVIGYGHIEKEAISASVGSIKASILEEIYATDQVPAKISFISFNPEISPLYESGSMEATNQYVILQSDGDQDTFGKDYVYMRDKDYINSYRKLEEKDFNRFAAAVNDMKFKVVIDAYTNIDGKGPVPEVPVDITASDKLSLAITRVTDPDNPVEYGEADIHAFIEDQTLKIRNMSDDIETYNVCASYNYNDESACGTDIRLSASKVKSRLRFQDVTYYGNFLMLDLKFSEIIQYNRILVKGQICALDGAFFSAPIDVPESLIGAGEYPDVAPISDLNLNYYKQLEQGANGYGFQFNESPVAPVALDLAKPTTPAFDPVVLSRK
ncbi:MAG: hypothetical protein ACI376_08135 [Candidatus Bruticola sp.]